MCDGNQIIDSQCQPLNKHGCKVVYSEEFRPANMEKKLAVWSLSWMGRRKNEKKLQRLMEQWEKEIRQLYG